MKSPFTFCSRILPNMFLLVLLVGSVLIPALRIAHAADGDYVWAERFGQTADDEGYDIFVDGAGNVYTTGYFRGTVDFDPGPGTFELTSAGNSRDIFISKLDSGGSLVWAKAIGGVSNDFGWGIVADSSGNVYTTGDFVGTVDFDPGTGPAENFALTSVGSSDIFISKLDSNGNFAGAWAMGGTADDYGFGIFVDTAGNIYTTGYFKNTVDFDPGGGTFNLTSTGVGVEDVFICKLDSTGNFAWAKGIGGVGADVGLGISLYSTGNVYLTGWFQGTVDFDPGPGTASLTSSGGSSDIYVSKLDSNGNFVWARAMGGVSEDIGQAVAVDSVGNIYTTGWFIGTADFDPGTGLFSLTSSGIASDIFISKLNSNGNFVWAKAMGGAAADVGYGISVDSSGNIYTTGGFSDTADFDPGAATSLLTSAGNADIFISKLTGSGSFVWAKAMGGPATDYGYDVAVSPAGDVHTTGSFQGTADFDPGPGTFNLVSAGFEDIFISKLAGPDPVTDTPFPWVMFLPAITGQGSAQL
ncbi:MAG: SBBP repeat-containing protein [Desulfobulbaceae bacterium]